MKMPTVTKSKKEDYKFFLHVILVTSLIVSLILLGVIYPIMGISLFILCFLALVIYLVYMSYFAKEIE